LKQIGYEYGCSLWPLQTTDLLQRAEEILQQSEKLNCRKFLTPSSLVAGNPELNLAFIANLFNNHHCLEPLTKEEKRELEDFAEMKDFDPEGEGEICMFTLWINSLDLQPTLVSFMTSGTA
jgi:plastin-1